MIPYLHLGPLNLPTFGLMVATGLLVASYTLQADFRRGDPLMHSDYRIWAGRNRWRTVVSRVGVAYEFFANPWPQLYSRFGFAWFGGFLGGLRRS
jgi:hypothetical protein